MKQKIDRITTGAKSISLRTLAMVLCFVMLLSAIGVGTVITAIAKSSNAKAAAAGALSRAVADVAVDEDAEDDDVVITKKADSDLADTGAKVALAGTGETTYNNGYNFSGGKVQIFFKKSSGTINGYAPGDSGSFYDLSKNDNEKYYGNWYFKTNTDSTFNYYYQVVHNSNYLYFGTYFAPSINGDENKSWKWKKDGGNTANDTLTVPSADSGYVHVYFDVTGNTNSNNNGYQKWYAVSVPVLSGGTLSSGADSIYAAGNTTLSKTDPTGGSGSNTAGDYSYTWISGDESKKTSASISGDTFTAPSSVSTDTVYRVSVTYRDVNCPNLTRTLTKDITVKPNTFTATISETGGNETTRSAAPTLNNSTEPGGSSSYSSVQGTTVYVHTHQNEGYKAIVSVSGVDVTRDSSNLFHFTMPATSKTVSVSYATLATDLSITAHSNDSSLGTVTVDKASADEDETVTVTLTVVGTNAVLDNQSFRVTKVSDGSSVTATYVSGTTSPLVYSFTMPDGDVIVYAEFEEHLDDADFWYDAYQREGKDSEAEKGNLVESEPFNLQFTESAYNGNLFAYVEVTREDADPCEYSASQTWAGRQPFAIRTGTDPATAAPSSGNRFYFKIPNWSDFSNTPTLKFYTGNTVIKSDNCNHFKDDGSYKVWYYDVPAGADGVQVFGSNNASTVKVTGSLFNGGGITWSTAYGSNISVSSYDSGQGNQYTPSAVVSGDGAYWDYTTSKTADVDGINYAYIGDVTDGYSNKALEGGYNGKVGSGSTPMLKSEILNQPYYVIILYPGYDYGDIYETGTSVSSADHYRVYVSDKLPGTPDLTVNYFAKDGVVRMWSKSTGVFGTTTVTATDYVTAGTRKNFNQDGNCSNKSGAYEGWQKDETWLEGTCTKGQNITVTTTLDASVKDKYYIKGFSFNGVTPQIFEWRSDGIYTCTYSIPEDLQGNKLEITPIYFLKDDSNCINFYIDGYNDTVKSAWGNELYVYPFYQYYKNGVSGTVTDLAGQAENYRAYPGQPVINYGGRRYMQIPLTDDGAANGYRIKGVTINNGYWDQVHGDTRGEGDGHDNLDTMGADFVNVHRQTYDYDDFYKIYNEYGKGAGKTLNNIYFTFKYRADGEQHRGTYADNKDTKADQNSDNAAALTSENASTHTWELLKNNFNKPVDLFGNELTDAALTTYDGSEMYVISEGYEANNAGKFATEWAIYKKSGSDYTKVTESGGKTSIVPSVLVISEASRINATQYPALDGDLATTGYKGIYEALEEYKGVPVKICYEKELHGGSKSGGYDPAYRSDGRWTFTKTTDYVKADIKIEYINEKNGVTEYTQDPFTTNSNVGSITGAKAYFTYNAAESGYGAQYEGATSLSGLHIQDNKYFNFAAETAGSYEFMGWYSIDTNGDYHVVNNDDIKKATGHSSMSSDSTFVARFKYVSNGSLFISHSLVAGDTGLGTTYLGVYVNGVQIADEATNTNSVRLDKTYIGSNKTTNTITIKLRTVPIGDTTFTAYTAEKVDPNEEAT